MFFLNDSMSRNNVIITNVSINHEIEVVILEDEAIFL